MSVVNEKIGRILKISDVGVLGNTAQYRTTRVLLPLRLLRLLKLSFQSSRASLGGHTITATIKEEIAATIKAIFQPMVALIKASEINNAISNAWKRFIAAFAISRLRLFVQNILQRLTQVRNFVKRYYVTGKLIQTHYVI